MRQSNTKPIYFPVWSASTWLPKKRHAFHPRWVRSSDLILEATWLPAGFPVFFVLRTGLKRRINKHPRSRRHQKPLGEVKDETMEPPIAVQVVSKIVYFHLGPWGEMIQVDVFWLFFSLQIAWNHQLEGYRWNLWLNHVVIHYLDLEGSFFYAQKTTTLLFPPKLSTYPHILILPQEMVPFQGDVRWFSGV